MANTYIGARSPKGNVGVRGVVDSGELSDYTAGKLSGFNAASVASMTLNIGGVSGTQDVAVAKNPGGESELLVGTAGQSIAFVIGAAPGTPGQSRTDALVIYKDQSATSIVNDGIDLVDYQVVAGTAATTGSQVPPSLATIRAAIPSGTLKFVAVIGYYTIAYGQTSVSTGSFIPNHAVSSHAPVVVANATERNLLPAVAGLKCWQTDTAMEQIYDGSNWLNIPRLLKKVTLTSAGDTISVTGIPLRDNLQVKAFCDNTGGTIAPYMRLNNDSGNNYAYDVSYTGAAYAATTSTSYFAIQPAAAPEAYPAFIEASINNSSTDMKIVTSKSNDAFGTNATTAVNFSELFGKYASNTQVTRVDVLNSGAGDFAIGSYVEIYG